MHDLSDKVIIITGASSGIGAATALACARAGMDVVINARRADRLTQLAAQISELGTRAHVVPGDIAEPGMSDRLLASATMHFGKFDVVFANAGYGMHRAMHEISAAEFRSMFEVNFFAGVDLLQRAARRLMERNQPGHLLMCSSCLAKFTLPFAGPYCATKAAQTHICRAMRMELRPHKIEVSSVHPIGTRTEFFAASAQRSGEAQSSSDGEIPRRFMQSPERVANAIVKCLRRPCPEVWTSLTVRLAAAAMTLWPRLNDLAMNSRAAQRLPR